MPARQPAPVRASLRQRARSAPDFCARQRAPSAPAPARASARQPAPAHSLFESVMWAMREAHGPHHTLYLLRGTAAQEPAAYPRLPESPIKVRFPIRTNALYRFVKQSLCIWAEGCYTEYDICIAIFNHVGTLCQMCRGGETIRS